jgi:hypothetical protein
MLEEVTKIANICYPIEYQVDIQLLLDSTNELLARLGNPVNAAVSAGGFSVNLTHLPQLTGSDRWSKYTGNGYRLMEEGVNACDFTQHLEEAQDLYIGQVIRNIYQLHPGGFQGRASLAWRDPKSLFPLHQDLHTPHRYHIALMTNPQCYWLFRNQQGFKKLHMPADGRVWYVDPTKLLHTFINASDYTRLHLLLTSCID